MNPPPDWPTTLGLAAATLTAALGATAATARIRGKLASTAPEITAAITATLLGLAVFIYRNVAVHETWAPLTSQTDGLALLTALLGLILVTLQTTKRLAGLSAFTLAALAVLALWGVCSSWWTWRVFRSTNLLATVHVATVFIGLATITVSAAAAALWLYTERQLKRKDNPTQRRATLTRLADLESIEKTIRVSAIAAFILLTIMLITGTVIISADPDGGTIAGFYASPKVVSSFAAWLVYLFVMLANHLASLRGKRAAILTIIGFLLTVTALSFAQSTHTTDTETTANQSQTTGEN